MAIELALGESVDILNDLRKERLPKGKGKKECPQCNVYLAAASKSCECGFSFYKVKKPKKSKKYREVDWRSLQRGDIIYIENTDVWVDPEGVSIPMGESGEFKVQQIRSDGLVLFSKSGYSFQDMVHEGYNKKTGITRGKVKVYQKKTG